MPRNDDGEYELVLGNRQLLSGFFFVVVLFGIFFTMGYFVGRHSSAGTVNAGQPAVAPRPDDLTPESTTTASNDTTSPEPGKAQVVSASPATKGRDEPPVATAVPARPSETQPVETAESRPAATQPPPSAPAYNPAAGSLNLISPNAGDIYLQVSAPAPAAAGSVVETLKRKGISSVLAPGPDSGTVRVLVGPLVPADIPDARTKLENAGFKPFVRKY